ncbi:MAG TPA: hypothetical protein VF184_05255 [Phycisphaeraceae bacterium]
MIAPLEIVGLSAAVIPQERFPFTRWYRASGPWYYHRPGKPDAACLDEGCYELIDPDLRPLCRLLHRLGLATTPSCQGHFYPKSYFQRIWAILEREGEWIRTDGLVVRDSETGLLQVFHDEHYQLPWPDAEAFCREAMAQQSRGYLGILVPPERGEWVARLEEIAGQVAGVRVGHQELGRCAYRYVVSLLMDTGDATRQTRAWERITALIGQRLERVGQRLEKIEGKG